MLPLYNGTLVGNVNVEAFHEERHSPVAFERRIHCFEAKFYFRKVMDNLLEEQPARNWMIHSDAASEGRSNETHLHCLQQGAEAAIQPVSMLQPVLVALQAGQFVHQGQMDDRQGLLMLIQLMQPPCILLSLHTCPSILLLDA